MKRLFGTGSLCLALAAPGRANQPPTCDAGGPYPDFFCGVFSPCALGEYTLDVDGSRSSDPD